MTVAGQLGFKTEVTYGTAVTVDLFHTGFLSGNPVREQPPLISNAIRAGRRTPSCVSTGAKTVEGTISTELYVAPLATQLKHMFGTIGTAGAGPYTHTASPGTTDDKSLTIQVGIPDSSGTVQPFTYKGAKFQGWTLGATAGEIATLELDVVAQDYVTATALASASYLSGCPFTFVHGSVSVAGTPLTEVKGFELSCSRPLRKEHVIGSALIMKPVEIGRSEYSIEVDTEFTDLTLHDLANSAVAVVLAFSDGTNSLTITCNAWVTATTPEVGGEGSVTSFGFSAMPYGSTDANAITAVLVNSEASAA